MRGPHPDRMPRSSGVGAQARVIRSALRGAQRSCPHASPSPSPLPLLLAGCGGSEKPAAAPPPPPQDGDRRHQVVQVQAGDRARPGRRRASRSSTRDTAGHTATFTAGPSKLDTDRLEKGERAALTFPKAGRYAYVCAFHAFMKGEVIVDE